jgi:hypothetical protein
MAQPWKGGAVAFDKRDRMLENIAVASALGFLALLVAGISLTTDFHAQEVEISALSSNPSAVTIVANHVGDPAFDRVYKITEASGFSYGAVLSLRSTDCSALVAARFSRQGELKSLRLITSPSARLPTETGDLVSRFSDTEATLGRVAEAIRGCVAAEAGS